MGAVNAIITQRITWRKCACFGQGITAINRTGYAIVAGRRVVAKPEVAAINGAWIAIIANGNKKTGACHLAADVAGAKVTVIARNDAEYAANGWVAIIGADVIITALADDCRIGAGFRYRVANIIGAQGAVIAGIDSSCANTGRGITIIIARHTVTIAVGLGGAHAFACHRVAKFIGAEVSVIARFGLAEEAHSAIAEIRAGISINIADQSGRIRTCPGDRIAKIIGAKVIVITNVGDDTASC